MTTSTLTVPVSAGDHVIGQEDAAVTLVEYGDYECPHCGAAYPIVEELLRQMGNHVRFVFRHFPLTQIHPHAEMAAEAAESAGAQDRFWEMHDAIFRHQNALDHGHLVRYAGQIGLNTEEFTEVLAAHRFRSRVREDFMGGVRSGVNGTPTFFINGVRHDGPFDLATLTAALSRKTAP